MRLPLRSSDFSHSRSFSAPSVPTLRLTPPTPHGSFHETDYNSDDSIPASAAAMPRPNRYRRSQAHTNSHPYAPTKQGAPSTAPTSFSRDQYRSVNPGHFRGTLNGTQLAAFSVLLSPDGMITIHGQLVPNRFPSQDVKERRSLSQPSSPLFFQAPIDPSIAALGLQSSRTTKTDSMVGSPQHRITVVNTEREHIVPLVNHHSTQMDTEFDYFNKLQAQLDQQGFPVWPVEQLSTQ